MTPWLADRLAGAAVAAGAILLFVALRYFKRIDWRLLRWSVRALFTGALAGAALLFAPASRGEVNAIIAGALLTAAAVSLRSENGDWVDALLTGGLAGAGAGAVQMAVPLNAHDTEFLRAIMAGTVAGAGSHLAVVAGRRWLWPLLAVTTALASVASVVPHLPSAFRFDPRSLTVSWMIVVAIVVVAVVLRRWSVVVGELREESTLGFFDGRDIANVAHPFKRLFRGAWRDEPARRRFVERANELAIRKRQQRKMSADSARLYQLEILKLRMEVQEIAKVRDAMARDGAHGSGLTAP